MSPLSNRYKLVSLLVWRSGTDLFENILIYALFDNMMNTLERTVKTTPIRRIAVRETCFSWDHGGSIEGPWNPSDNHSTIVSSSLRRVLIGLPLCRETSVFQTANVFLFPSGAMITDVLYWIFPCYWRHCNFYFQAWLDLRPLKSCVPNSSTMMMHRENIDTTHIMCPKLIHDDNM